MTVIQGLPVDVTSSTEELDVLLQGSKIHYRIKEPLWNGGLQFSEFVEFLLNFFRRETE